MVPGLALVVAAVVPLLGVAAPSAPRCAASDPGCLAPATEPALPPGLESLKVDSLRRTHEPGEGSPDFTAPCAPRPRCSELASLEPAADSAEALCRDDRVSTWVKEMVGVCDHVLLVAHASLDEDRGDPPRPPPPAATCSGPHCLDDTLPLTAAQDELRHDWLLTEHITPAPPGRHAASRQSRAFAHPPSTPARRLERPPRA